MADFDVIVIGGGPGGYVAAIKAAQLGLKVACVEKRGTLGGTCLNVGCIPSKNLLHVSEQFETTKDHLKDLGITARGVDFNIKTIVKNNAENIEGLCQGIEMLFRKNKVEYINGRARITAPGKVEVDGGELTSKHIVIATGSEVMPLPGVEADHEHILTSDSVFKLDRVPKTMAVIGGGYIGLEMGSVWRRLGTKVTVIEFADSIVPAMDQDLGKELHKQLAKQGLEFKLGTKVLSAEVKSGKVITKLENLASGDTEEVKFEKVLLSIGRRPYTEGLGLDSVGVELDDRGRVKTDHSFKTNIPGVYAIGDVTDGPMLAHKAEEEGVALAEILAGQAGHIDYNTIPAVVYTSPEVASVGKTEHELKAADIDYKMGKFAMMANSRARTIGKTAGFVKVLACAKTDKLLGVHIIAHDAGTMIAEGVAVMAFGGSSEDLARICHAHPTLNEAVKEAALATFSKAIHS